MFNIYNKPRFYNPANVAISGGTLTGTSINSGQGMISGRLYGGLGNASNTGSAQTADVTYCCPFYLIRPVNSVVSLGARISGAGTTSNAKVGIATMNATATTATMITQLNPTGVATTGTGDFTASFTPAVNLKGGTFYLLCMIGAGAAMPTFTTTNNASSLAWATGYVAGNFFNTVTNGYTSAANTYTGGFGATFALTASTSTAIPHMGIIAP